MQKKFALNIIASIYVYPYIWWGQKDRWLILCVLGLTLFAQPSDTEQEWTRAWSECGLCWTFSPLPAQDLPSMSFMNTINFSHYFVLLLLLNDDTHLEQRSEFSQKFWFMIWIDHPGALMSPLHCCQVPVGRCSIILIYKLSKI